MNQLLRIEAPHFVAGIEIDGAIGCYDYDYKPVTIHRCAPILKYMEGWTVSRIKYYCKKKGWSYQLLQQTSNKPNEGE